MAHPKNERKVERPSTHNGSSGRCLRKFLMSRAGGLCARSSTTIRFSCICGAVRQALWHARSRSLHQRRSNSSPGLDRLAGSGAAKKRRMRPTQRLETNHALACCGRIRAPRTGSAARKPNMMKMSRASSSDPPSRCQDRPAPNSARARSTTCRLSCGKRRWRAA